VKIYDFEVNDFFCSTKTILVYKPPLCPTPVLINFKKMVSKK